MAETINQREATEPEPAGSFFLKELGRGTLLVGTRDSLRELFPAVAEKFMHCDQLMLCGELPEDDPAAELWQRIQALQPERIWIVGGDGTINLAGQCALRTEWKLPSWLTPGGTANDLARALSDRMGVRSAGLDPEWPRIGDPVSLDLLKVTLDHNPWVKCAANMFTLGTSARNTHHVTPEIKSRWGAFAYLTQIWRAMGDLQPFSIQLTVGQSETKRVDQILNVFVANGPYCGGGFRVAPTAQIDDGKLDVILLRQGSAAELAHLATTFLTGNHLEHALVEHFTATHVEIQCDEPSPLTLDGEAFTAQHIVIDVCHGRLPINLVVA